ncbi:hypothetical protein AXF42_Ash015361 [Apostasia shenzhenica]|uniref:PB1 domain-containing protein n=1 Tax=Apostasia shenzhenica TaxID=1088818 RepID=A0A2I0ALZ2_9ASPA|nr:hypothetical protein AXF42_Ash015361 [Apostasia shenzhenica]
METMNASGGMGIGYADSVDSSPRSRGGESWDEPFPSSAAAAAVKLRLMCSYGGRIVPRPTDKSLCYLGGETRIVVVDRHTTLADLSAKLSRSLLAGNPFTLKYQLPNEDLDSLISVSTDEDLDNMIDEYDRILASASGGIGGSRSSRLRLFLFPSKPESAPSSIGSLLDDSKSENWFVDALNGAIAIDGLPRGLSADSSSVNCLLGLEDESSVHSRSGMSAVGGGGGGGGVEHEPLVLPRPDSSSKLARPGMEVQSVPDSPMVETASSFGSTSSAPYLSNLPPIRVRADDRPMEQRIGGLEDHFSQINISAAGAVAGAVPGQRLADEGGFKDTNFPVGYPPPTNIAISTSSNPSAISPSEVPSNKALSDDNKSDHGGVHKPQQKPTPVDSPPMEPGTRPMYYQERIPPAPAGMSPIPEPKREVPVTGYVLPPAMPPAEQQFRQHQAHAHQLTQLPPPQQQQQQQQFIPANPHYLHHATGTVVPFPSYYQIPIQQTQQSHPFDQQQFPVYYLPVRQNPAPSPPYNMPTPTAMTDTNPPGKPAVTPLSKVIQAKPELPPNLYRAAMPANSGAVPSMIQVAADQGLPYTGMGYHVMHHHHPPQAPSAVPSGFNYEFSADPTVNSPVYYTQATSPPGLAPQYQTVVSSAAVVTDAAATLLQQSEIKHTRAS